VNCTPTLLASAWVTNQVSGYLASHGQFKLAGHRVDRLEFQTSSRLLLTVNQTVSKEILPDLVFANAQILYDHS
jgi:hypothetical protein